MYYRRYYTVRYNIYGSTLYWFIGPGRGGGKRERLGCLATFLAKNNYNYTTLICNTHAAECVEYTK